MIHLYLFLLNDFTLNEPVDATLMLAVDAREPRLG